MPARVLAVLAVAVTAPSLAPAGARADAWTGAVRTSPALTPEFGRAVLDYVVRCRAGDPVRFSVDPPPGVRVALGDRPTRTGRFEAAVRLVPGRAVRIRFRSASETRVHSVRCLPADFRNFHSERTGRPQAEWYLLTPDLHRSGGGYAAVFDNNGVPVWWWRQRPAPITAQLLPDGNFAWTNWARKDRFDRFQSITLAGEVVRRYAAVGWPTNHHEFQGLPNGNAYVLAYPARDGVDLSRWGGPRKATVLDSEIQEIDPAGNLLWRWNTAHHIATRETPSAWFEQLIHRTRPIELPDGRKAYDIAHLNSIEPFGDQLVVSLRHTNAVYALDRGSGRIRWKLGGRSIDRSLRVKGDPLWPKVLDGQHDARLYDGGRTLTVFDNGTRARRRPRALEFRLDLNQRTATLVRSLVYRGARGRSTCCGSTRRMRGGNFVTAWGNSPFVTEQTPSGRVVLLIALGEHGSTYRAEPVPKGVISRSALRRGMDAMAP